MEQQNEQPIEPVQSSKNIWIIVVSIVATALIVGGGVYAWQKSNLNNTKQNLQQQISVLQNQVSQLQQAQTNKDLPIVNQNQQQKDDTTPTQPTTNQAVCGKLIKFKNEPWADNLATLYKNDFLRPQGLDGDLWPGEVTMAGEVSSCKMKDLFMFIPEFFEFGCGRIFKYDTKSNVLEQARGTYCASEFKNIDENYIEFTGWQGDGGSGTQYKGKYYYEENRTELGTKN